MADSPLKAVRLRGRAFVAVGLLVLLAGLVLGDRLGLLRGAPASDQGRYHNRVFTVVKVVDGDTLDVGIADEIRGKETTRIRLWGVDTPETKDPRRPAGYFGAEASAFAAELVLGEEVTVALEPFRGSRGKYGRLLAYVFLADGRMLNGELIAQGYGFADERFDHVYRDKFEALQKMAQKEKRGLWKDGKLEQFPAWYRKRHGQ